MNIVVLVGGARVINMQEEDEAWRPQRCGYAHAYPLEVPSVASSLVIIRMYVCIFILEQRKGYVHNNNFILDQRKDYVHNNNNFGLHMGSMSLMMMRACMFPDA